MRNDGGKLLIIGGRATNFTENLREHPRFIFWDSVDPDTRHKTKIPSDVVVIIFARFIKHKIYRRIKKIVPSDVLVLQFPLQTGQIREVLGQLTDVLPNARKEAKIVDKPAVETRPEPAIATVAPPAGEAETIRMAVEPEPQATEAPATELKLVKLARGVLAKFVDANANFQTPDAFQEIRRLFTLAQEQGFKTTERSLGNAFYAGRINWQIAQLPRRRGGRLKNRKRRS